MDNNRLQIQSINDLTLDQIKLLGGKRFYSKLRELGLESLSVGDSIIFSPYKIKSGGKSDIIKRMYLWFGRLYVDLQGNRACHDITSKRLFKTSQDETRFYIKTLQLEVDRLDRKKQRILESIEQSKQLL